MEELTKSALELQSQVEDACERIGLPALIADKEKLANEAAAPNFWDDAQAAQSKMKQLSKLENRVDPWVTLRQELADVLEMANLGDQSMQAELTEQLESIETRFDKLKADLKLIGPYDDYDAIVSIYAGAGGTDAQDWAGMLMRMYVRWAEKHDMQAVVIEESVGDEAGIKSVTLEISGSFAYGKLKSEHGVHRLVRLSPFNSDNLRQTSFAKVDVLPKVDKPDELEVDEKDLRIDVFRSGGHGGQSVNTTDSAVRITHLPTNIVVVIQNERSQLQNRETAMTIMRSRLAQLQLEQHKEEISELKGPNEQAAWGNQIRNYVLHPYKQVKDVRTRYETSNVDIVLDGDIDALIDAYLEYSLGK